MKLGEFVYNYRKTHRLSLRAMADQCRTSFQYIQKMEKGEILNPSIEMLAKIASGMGLSIDELLAQVDEMPISFRSDGTVRLVEPFVLTPEQIEERDERREKLIDLIMTVTLDMSAEQVEHLDEIIRAICKKHL